MKTYASPTGILKTLTLPLILKTSSLPSYPAKRDASAEIGAILPNGVGISGPKSAAVEAVIAGSQPLFTKLRRKPPPILVMKPPGGAPIGILMPWTSAPTSKNLSLWNAKLTPKPTPSLPGAVKGKVAPAEPLSDFCDAEYFATRLLIVITLKASISSRSNSNPSNLVPFPDSVGSAIVADCGLPFSVK